MIHRSRVRTRVVLPYFLTHVLPFPCYKKIEVVESLHGDGASLERAIGIGFRAAFLADHDDRSLAIETWPFGVFQRLKVRGDMYYLPSMPCIIDG